MKFKKIIEAIDYGMVNVENCGWIFPSTAKTLAQRISSTILIIPFVGLLFITVMALMVLYVPIWILTGEKII